MSADIKVYRGSVIHMDHCLPEEFVSKSDYDKKVKLLEAALEKCKEQREFLRKNYVGYWGNSDEIDAKVKILIDANDAELAAILTPKPSEG